MSTILIGVDSSARSEDAVALGGRLAAAGCAGVIVATIVPFDGVSRVDAHGTVRRLSGLLESPPAERVRTGVLLARSPAQGLRGLAETEAAELVVVGSTHTGHLGRVRPGSTGEHLLMGAPCAVAVAPCGYRTRRARPIERIGVAWEGSGEARAALAAAISAAGALRAELEVITVVTADLYEGAGLIAGESDMVIRGEVTAEIRRDLDDIVAGAAELVPTAGVMLDGRPSHQLAEYSAKLDLLFIGSRGYGPLHAVATGATSGAVMRSAQCPVIVLPRGADAPLAAIFEEPTAAAG